MIPGVSAAIRIIIQLIAKYNKRTAISLDSTGTSNDNILTTYHYIYTHGSKCNKMLHRIQKDGAILITDSRLLDPSVYIQHSAAVYVPAAWHTVCFQQL